MRRGLKGAILGVAVMFVVGCATTPTKSDHGNPNGDEFPTPELLEHIPKDTTFAFVSYFEAPSKELRERYRAVGQRMTSSERLQRSMAENLSSELYDALWEMFKQRDDLESFYKKAGVKVDGLSGCYGYEMQPVCRMELADGKAFESFVESLAKSADLEVEKVGRDGITYRRLSEDEDGTVLLWSGNDEVVGAFTYKENVSDALIKHMAGKTLPDESIGETRYLHQMAYKHEFVPHGPVGFLSFKRLADAYPEIFSDVSEVCRREMKSLAGKMPRLIYGMTRFDLKENEQLMALDIRNSSIDLMSTKGDYPGYSKSLSPGMMLKLGLGFNIEGLRKQQKKLKKRFSKNPYECEEEFFQKVNSSMTRKVSQGGLTGVLKGLRGVYIGVKSLDVENRSGRAIAVIQTRHPEKILGQMQMMSRSLANINVAGNGKPTEVSQLQEEFPSLPTTWIARDSDSLGFGFGKKMGESLSNVITAKRSSVSVPAFMLEYDALPLRRLLSSWSDQPGQNAPQYRGFANLLSGPTRIELDYDNQGVYLRVRMRVPKPDESGKVVDRR